MLDRSSVIGMILGTTLIAAAILLQGELGAFISIASLLIVVGGVVAATMVNFSFENIKDSFSTITSMIGAKGVDLRTDMELLGMFARRVRNDGFLVLDKDLPNIRNSFLRDGLQLAVDGFKKESLDQILRSEIRSRERQVEISIRVMEAMSSYAPAFGMIGTVIGMVLMLQNISDPESLGAGLAIALITTLYGTILSNMFLGPLAGKLHYLSKIDINRKEMVRVGILSMVDGENPRVMDKKMLIYVDPKARAEYLRFHENVHSNTVYDERLYNDWVEQQGVRWHDLRRNLETG